jgi:hypothetical protein
MFHLTENLYFEKLPNGAVRIVKKSNAAYDAGTVFEVTIDANQWASVIASMSHYGEENYGFYRALSFHRGDDVHPTTLPAEGVKRLHWPFKDVPPPSIGGSPVATMGESIP